MDGVASFKKRLNCVNMKTGIVLFAYNNEVTDYYEMARWTAKRAMEFCNLPVTVITDNSDINKDNVFDQVIVENQTIINHRNGHQWLNCGRYKVFELTPYTTTILLDSDYIINSNTLRRLFEIPSDFLCHKNATFLMDDPQTETIGKYGPSILWATVVKFAKTRKTEQIFSLMSMIEQNWNHYQEIYNFSPGPYRNDYALAIALRTINGQIENSLDYIPWNLLNISSLHQVDRLDHTKYRLTKTYIQHNNKRSFTLLQNLDFHMLDKQNCLKIMDT